MGEFAVQRLVGGPDPGPDYVVFMVMVRVLVWDLKLGLGLRFA